MPRVTDLLSLVCHPKKSKQSKTEGSRSSLWLRNVCFLKLNCIHGVAERHLDNSFKKLFIYSYIPTF